MGYLNGFNVITRVLIRERQEVRVRDVTGGAEIRNGGFEDADSNLTSPPNSQKNVQELITCSGN